MKKVMIILAFLIIIFFALIFYQRSNVSIEDRLSIKFDDQELFLSYSKLRSNEQISITTARGDDYLAYDLSNIFKSLKIPFNKDTSYTFRSNDGGSLTIKKADHEDFYLVFDEDANGQFIRLVIPTDQFSQRWIKYLRSITIK